MTGVYLIKNLITGHSYIGSATTTFRKRELAHWWYLRRGTHNNSHLQRAWNKYGEEAFQFEVIVRCSPEWSICMEQIYILKHKATGLCYNIRDATGPGLPRKGDGPVRQYKKHIATKQSAGKMLPGMSARRKKWCAENPWFIKMLSEKGHSKETNAKHSEAMKKKWGSAEGRARFLGDCVRKKMMAREDKIAEIVRLIKNSEDAL